MASFFFYDLETSGLSPRSDRIMQFAGIRTDSSFNQIGEAVNLQIKLNDDTLPSPDAVLVTGITPQSTQADGLTEAEFAAYLCSDIFTENTITVGFNNVRFDDEFIRHLFWRTFRDPYEWCWKNGCSRWDMLDVVRMTRALRPDGIEWPVDENGKPTNRLELLTKANGIGHTKAHDALSDVEALIDVTKLLHSKQPKLFNYLLTMRDKKAVQKLVNLETKQPFVYTSGRYDAAYGKTTIALPIASAQHGNVLVYDLRHDPTEFINLSEEQLSKRLFASWEERKADDFVPVPVKALQYNRCPAVAPVGVLEQANGWEALHVNQHDVQRHMALLAKHPDFAERIRTAFESRKQYESSGNTDAEGRLYDGFLSGADAIRVESVRNADARGLSDFHPSFDDERLSDLLLRYKARNYPQSLSEEEMIEWEQWRANRLQSQLPAFVSSLERLSQNSTSDTDFILQELQLWAEAIIPAPSDN